MPDDPQDQRSAQTELELLCMRHVLANPQQRVFFKDLEGRYLLLSESYLAVLPAGASLAEMNGKTDFDVYGREHALEALADEQRILKTGQPMIAKLERRAAPGLPTVWVTTNKFPLRDEHGTIIGTWGTAFDSSAQVKSGLELSRSRRQLRSSERQYRRLFDANPQPLIAFERATFQIVAVSNATVACYGYTREELLSMHLRDLTPAEDLEALAPNFARGASKHLSGFAGARERRHRYKDGTIIDVEITSDDLVLDGIECRLLLCLNVTERNRLHEALAIARDDAVDASNLKSAFVANISHEIRTPMNGVIGMSELLLETELTEEQRGYAEQVEQSGARMLAIIGDILDISKIETGHLQLDVTEFSLGETVEQVRAQAGLQADAKGVALNVLIDRSTPQLVLGDCGRLHQILLNLVANAVKFTAVGEVTIQVTPVARLGTDSLIRIAVRDSGIGISADALTRMFDAFTQADISTTRKYGGTGLGLAIARELVELMGGEIGAESELGHGSTFWFELALPAPAAGDGKSPTAGDGATSGVAPFWSSAPLVLVAEDNPVNQIVAVRALGRCGCDAEVVADGLQALNALANKRYDAVLMDCQMPEMDGYDATAELRRREHGGHRTPVIAMTANAMRGDRERCLAAGMDAHISKPMPRQELIDALHHWIPARPGSVARDAAPPTPVR
jgi:PAS domain S-box-containing protein